MSIILTNQYKSPIGNIKYYYTGNIVVGLCFEENVTYLEEKLRKNGFSIQAGVSFVNLEQYLHDYFSGNIYPLPNDIKVLQKTTPFQKIVIEKINKIPAGKTKTYSDLAKSVDSQANQAIGSVCAFNKILLLIPCHRVVSTNGKSFHYAGGSDRKKWLLDHELKNT